VFRFALRPRWIVLHVLVLTVVGLFALAGVWQLHRLGEKRERNAMILERRTHVATTIKDVKRHLYERAHLSGTYDTDNEFVLIGRPNAAGQGGNHVLTPLRVGSRTIVVDRGWVPFETARDKATPVRRRVEVTGFLMPPERSPLGTSKSSSREVSRIDTDQIAAALPYRIEPAYVLLQTQTPPQRGLPETVPPPNFDEGPHKAYAMQWFLFIVVALSVYGALLRREASKTGGT
jgi:cytochrome oxidase assembly protein ShyY1